MSIVKIKEYRIPQVFYKAAGKIHKIVVKYICQNLTWIVGDPKKSSQKKDDLFTVALQKKRNKLKNKFF